MSKILSSTSESHTEYRDDAGRTALGRGLLDGQTKETFKTPDELPAYVATEHRLVLRQTIAVLDKVIRKSLTLRGISSDVYVHRAMLGEALWQQLKARFSAEGATDKDIAALRRKWQAKVHPYDKHGVNTQNPRSDTNFGEILDREEGDGKPPFRDALKKWGNAIWPQDGQKVDHAAIADTILDHLNTQELTIKNGETRKDRKGRPDNPPATGDGLMLNRGKSTAKSASDPRKRSEKLKNDWADSPERQAEKQQQDDKRPDAQVAYFEKSDLAKTIYDGVLDVHGRNERVYNAWFGDKTYEHFGALGGLPNNDAERQNIWNLHNAIRGYYKLLANSQKFRRALREVETASKEPDTEENHSSLQKLKALLPENEHQLLCRLTAGRENADMSEAIRLGKLLVHAAVTTEFGEAGGRTFDEQLSHYAASAGQSEIKRIETFARIWRQSSAIATRTLSGLTGVRHDDLNKTDVSRDAANEPLNHMREHLPVIFGSKEVNLAGYPDRASIFLSDDDDSQRENVWALIRLGAGIRDASHHFNIRKHLLARVKGGIVKPEDTPEPISQRNWKLRQVVRSDSAMAMGGLLAFDKEMRKEAVRLQLQALKAHEFLEFSQLENVISELGGVADFNDLVPPRFTSVINHVHALAENSDVNLHDDLTSLLCINKVSKNTEQTTDNLCRKGLMQLLYSSGFLAWFSEKSTGESICNEIIATIVEQKNDRVDMFQRKKHGKKIPTVSDMAEALGLHNYTTLQDLLKALAERAMRETDQDIRYRPNPVIQSATSNRIERFRQEVFAHLFTRYLNDNELGFLVQIKDHQPTETSVLDEAMSAFSDASLALSENWHAQFYTWLYLVPPTEISKLRHQMRKSVALETKSPSETDSEAVEMLRQMDRLMGLYTQVQAAGFGDNEHELALSAGGFLYEDEDDFGAVYSGDYDEQD